MQYWGTLQLGCYEQEARAPRKSGGEGMSTWHSGVQQWGGGGDAANMARCRLGKTLFSVVQGQEWCMLVQGHSVCSPANVVPSHLGFRELCNRQLSRMFFVWSIFVNQRERVFFTMG